MPELKNIRIALSGIYPYRVDELASLRLPPAPEWAKGKEFYNVYRPAIVLKKAVNLFSNLPLTHNHPQTPVNGDNFRNLALGWTGEKPFIDVVDNEVGIRSTVIMYDDEALKAYNNGEIQLSPGYVGKFAWQQGTAPDGQPYDIIMNKINSVNHLALLPIGRGGDNAVVLDTGENIPKRKTVFDIVKDFVKDDGENNISIFDFIVLRNEIADVLEMQAETADAGTLVTDVKYAEGTVRSRKDGDYRKQGGKWVKIYSGEGRGASLAVTHAVKKIKAAKNVDELMDLVNANISRFYDKNGKLLPVVQRLKEAVNESKTRINSAKKEGEKKKEGAKQTELNRDKLNSFVDKANELIDKKKTPKTEWSKEELLDYIRGEVASFAEKKFKIAKDDKEMLSFFQETVSKYEKMDKDDILYNYFKKAGNKQKQETANKLESKLTGIEKINTPDDFSKYENIIKGLQFESWNESGKSLDLSHITSESIPVSEFGEKNAIVEIRNNEDISTIIEDFPPAVKNAISNFMEKYNGQKYILGLESGVKTWLQNINENKKERLQKVIANKDIVIGRYEKDIKDLQNRYDNLPAKATRKRANILQEIEENKANLKRIQEEKEKLQSELDKKITTLDVER